MADISLYLNNVYSSRSEEDTDMEQTSDMTSDDFVRVNLGTRKKQRQQDWERVPRRIIHFSSGETMEEFSTDEEDDESEVEAPSPTNPCAYIWFYFLKGPAFLLWVVLYLGEKFAALFDITTGKYQYVVDTYYRQKEQEQEKRWKEMEADLAKEMEADLGIVPEESERHGEQLQSHADRDEPIKAHVDQDESSQSLDVPDEALTLMVDLQADAPSPPRVTYHMEEVTKGTLKDTFRLQELHHIV